jgi:hypothetical protein
MLLRMNLLGKDSKLQGFVLKAGFDPEGEYIELIRDIGFSGIEIG